jgi:hypothetical protein
MHMGNRCDLTVNERSGSAKRFKSRPFFPVPRRRSLVVRQDGERSLDDVTANRLPLPSSTIPDPMGPRSPPFRTKMAFADRSKSARMVVYIACVKLSAVSVNRPRLGVTRGRWVSPRTICSTVLPVKE